MRVEITSKDVGRKWTYDARQVFTIGRVKRNRVGMFGRRVRGDMTIKRLEELFECGRAEWGDCVKPERNIIRVSGGRQAHDKRMDSGIRVDTA
jgi:hypothetical protein